MGFTFGQPTPILRSFDEQKTRDFYVDFLGFEVMFEHRFSDKLPLYMSLQLGSCTLHLSEHHGDACPGACVRIPVEGLHEYQRLLASKDFAFARPGPPELTDWGTHEMAVKDSFGNTLRFFEAA